MFKTMTIALAGLGLTLAACGGGKVGELADEAAGRADASDIPIAGAVTDAAEAVEDAPTDNLSSATEEQCLALIQVTDDALEYPQVSRCRLAGHDPLWNAMGPFVSDLDYQVWRETGYVPTCDTLPGTANPLGGVFDGEDVAQCKELRDN